MERWRTSSYRGCVVRGRFAPSPTGDLHLGNLRTAIAAHERAVRAGGDFLIRMEDLDRVTSSETWVIRQMIDLAAVGVSSGDPVVRQSERFEIYNKYVRDLDDRGLTYRCFCSRKDIAEAASAPHGDTQIYGGRCRDLTQQEQESLARSRPAAIRLRVDEHTRSIGLVDDVVLVRNDGVPAYNLAVVVDDELQGVTEVVRGRDLESVTPSQQYLQQLLGFRSLTYVHLPLVVGPDGARLAKRHGGVTIPDCLRLGFSPQAVRRALLRSLEVGSDGWGPSSSLAEWLRSLL
jgi:glutamyl-tRNA synthetase